MDQLTRYKTRKLNLVRAAEFSGLRDCSLKSRGLMWTTFKRHHEDAETPAKNYPRVATCHVRGKIAGWGLSVDHGKKREIMLYVKRAHRRQGIGTTLFKKLAGKSPGSSLIVTGDVYNHKFFTTVLGNKTASSGAFGASFLLATHIYDHH